MDKRLCECLKVGHSRNLFNTYLQIKFVKAKYYSKIYLLLNEKNIIIIADGDLMY